MSNSDFGDDFPFDTETFEWLWMGGQIRDPGAELIACIDRCERREIVRVQRRLVAARRREGEAVYFGSGPRHGMEPLVGKACHRCGAHDTWYSTHEQLGAVVGFDARFCLVCDSWLESDGGWWTAAGELRPDRPSGVPFDNLVLENLDEVFY